MIVTQELGRKTRDLL